MSKFGDEYKRLNAKQREAVDTIEGPVLVIAGPGTGKTQLLSLRVANILTRTDAAPENILCLTFTNKAANNMRERLLDLVGSASLRVMVKTFHSFAVEIMNRYPDYFWNGARLVTVPGTVQLEIIQSVLDKLPLRSPLARKFAGEYTAIADVQTGLRLVKEAGLTPEKLRALITANEKFIDLIEPKLIQLLDKPLRRQQLGSLQAGLETLPKQPINRLIAPLVSLDSVLVDSFSYAVHRDQEIGKLTNLSQWKQRWLQTVDGKKSMLNERKRNSWWLELATVYAGYRDMLHRQGYYDYADMLVEVISQLEQNPDMLSEVQEQFLYVLIDEFQDTNAAQLRIAHLVADHHTSNSQPNLMVVGDDDQSIFKFNGAELNNMLNFRQFYKLKKPIILTQNYRSSQAILDTAKRVAEMAHDRLVTREPDLNKNLVAARPPRQTGLITHFRYPTRQHQLAAVAKEIERRFSPRNSVAVLARGHDSLRRLAVMLLESGIDVRYEQRNNVLEHEAVQHIHIMAKIVTAIQAGDEETVNTYLPQLLQHPMWRVKATTLWQLAVANHHQPHWLHSLLHHSNKQLQKLANWLLWLSGQSSEAPLPVMIEYVRP
ncbi:ATP-dependent helicase [Candidatus Saccharibacteria bacterium]|nr:ATP-dependent helicase [Candidatus Saccharibacteria bacterium]